MLLVVGVNLVHSQLHPRLHCRAQLRMHQIEHDRHTASLRAGAIPQYPPPARMDAPPARPQDRKIPYGVWGCILRGGQLAGGATLESGAPPATRLDRRDPARKNGCTSKLPRGSCGLAVLREVHQTYTREGPLYKTIVYTREGPI